MLRPFLTFLAASVAAPALAQVPAAPADQSTECLLRVNPAPASWIIDGHDPFSGSIPEGTFGVTFVNEGGADCRFVPVFELRQPPFGLSKDMGQPVEYRLLNLTDTTDATPRAGRSQRRATQREMVLKPRESRSLMYKLVAEPRQINSSGTFTQDVTLEAQDSQFRSLGGAPLVLGLTVLPSARISLAGSYTMSDGQAVVDLGELREGIAPTMLRLNVSSTGDYEIAVTSANSGQLRLGTSQWFVPYSVAIGGNALNLVGTRTVTGTPRAGLVRDSLPLQFIIGDVSNKRAGVYSDVLSVTITAR
ncbi:hypothetical protein AB1K62_07610 [Parasphingorhabdus sp. JC815]|uniref:hypothetical protein n=1 Tax=Parasphingorhabdus sp. JC815 TaxID=3232140 RepID=UPI003457838B